MAKYRNYIVLSLLIIFALYCAMQLGRTWDVFFHYQMGKDRLDYLFSLGSNKVNDTISVREFYTGAYATISAFFVQFFPRKYILESLYIINLFFSTLTVVGIYKISKELFNKNIAQIAFLFCFLNPIFFGHMAMNSTDTIIAFSNIWFFYTTLRYFKYQKDNNKKNKYVLSLGILMGLGLGVRYSFMVTLLPIFLFLFLEIFYFKTMIRKDFSKKIFVFDSLKVIIIAYLFMVFFWPQTHSNILLEPFRIAVKGLSFGFGVPFILYNGDIFLTNELPKTYILVNLFYKMPEFIILSFMLFILLFFKINSFFKGRIKGFNFKILSILLIIFFPNFLFLISPWGFYDGIRLFLYLIPFICIISAILFFYIYKMVNINFYKLTFLILIFLKIFYLYNFFTVTPYHYVYLNLFAGKYFENSEKFENDYWGVSTRKLISNIQDNRAFYGKKIRIATCGLPKEAQNFYLKKVKDLKYKIVDKDEKFDFIIMNNRVIWDLKSDDYNPKNKQTCFEKYKGEDLIKIEKRGLVLSKITRI